MKHILIVMMLSLWLNGVLFAAEANFKIIEKLGLKKHAVEGATVYYEPCFEEKLDVFEKAFSDYRKHMSELQKPAEKTKTALIAKKIDILDDICRIVGADDAQKTELMPVADKMSASFSAVSMPFVGSDNVIYLILQATTKDYLRSGGTLPNLTYDRASDRAEYQFFFGFDTDNSSNQEMLFPVPSVDQLDMVLKMIFSQLPAKMEQAPERMELLAIHEIAEVAIVGRMKTADPYKRWFTDGFANEITYEVARRHYSQATADAFIAQYAVDSYEDIKNQIDLQYWMSAQFTFVNHWPIEKEQDHIYARYCFATQEARRIVEHYGVECIKKILDTYEANGEKWPGDLITAIQQATGDDIQKHLKQYQDFETAQEGLQRYQKAYETAIVEKNAQNMIYYMLRMLDLRGEQPIDKASLNLRANIAELLYLTEHKESATASITEFADWMCQSNRPENHRAGQHLVILYALRINQPKIAADYARKTLEDHPEDLYALTIMMLNAKEENNPEKAKQLALKICELEPAEHGPCHEMAKAVLSAHGEEIK